MSKHKSRRNFIKRGVKLSLAAPLIAHGLTSCISSSDRGEQENKSNAKSLRILILGGTSFLGPHQLAYAIDRGHKVSTFTRGKTTPTIYPEYFAKVESLIGDRADNLSALENREWDVVIDNSGRKSEWTALSANLLKDKVSMYIYTSSTGVYYPYLGSAIDENTEVLTQLPTNLKNEEEEVEYGYGVMKASSEIEAIKAFGKDRTTIVRPTYMMGPADKTNRFIYWPLALSRGGEVLVPGANDPVQYIDVRDVAEWMIRLAEQKLSGTYNAVGPARPQTTLEFANEASQSFEGTSTLVSIDDHQFLKENGLPYLVPWIMPEGNNFGTAKIDNQKAKNSGLSFRRLDTSMQDMLAWWSSDAVTEERRRQFNEAPESVWSKEKSIIDNWRQAHAT